MQDPDTAHAAKPRPRRRNTRPGSPSFLRDPSQARTGEQIGAGYFVMRRGQRTGRIRAPEFPFEHPTLGDAMAEANRLSGLHPGETFEVYARVVELAP